MTSTIRIKRRNTGAPGAPPGLAASEIAYNEVDDTFWYGKGDNAGQAASVLSIGGPGAFLKTSGLADIGRNKIHNALFNIQQRGQGPWTASGIYTADRWASSLAGGDTAYVNINPLSDADRAGIGDESAINALQNHFTGTSSAASVTTIQQNIEGVRRLAGKTVTVSFFAASSPTGLKIGVNGYQNYGTGGSPSGADSWQATGASFSLTGVYQRFSATFTIPTSSGKTLGTNKNDSSVLQFFYSSGANNNNNAGNIGVQNGYISIWGVQLEIGSEATPLEKLDPRIDLANCQRFYAVFKSNAILIAAYAGSSFGGGAINFLYPVSMRASPAVAISNVAGSGPGVAVATQSATGVAFSFSGAGATAVAQYNTFDFTASADL